MATGKQHQAGPRRRFVPLVALLVLLAWPAQASAFDAAASPYSLTVGKGVYGPNTAATEEANEPLTAGGPLDCGGRKMGHTLWFKFVGTGQRMTIDTSSSNFTTVVGLYTPAQPPSTSSYLGCGQGSLTFQSTAGAEYRIQLGGACTPACGSGTYHVRAVQGPPNDDRGAAQTVNCCYQTGTVSLRYATTEPGELLSCGGKAISQTIWFRWIAPADGVVTLDSGARRTVAAFDEASGRRLDCGVAAPIAVEVAKGQALVVQVGRAPDATTMGVTFKTGFLVDHDVDNDGFSPPEDCNDHDPRINPDAFDRPRDGVDRNCDHTDRPDLVKGRINLYANAAGRGQPILGVARIRVEKAKRGSRVTVRCSGGACRHRKWTKKVRGKAVDYKRPLKNRKKFKATFVVMVTREKLIGRVSRFIVRSGELRPRRKNLCLFPGAQQPRRCSG